MGAARVVPLVLLLSGAIVIADALLRGGASAAVIVIFPVVFGASAEFLVGVLLLFLGFLTLPFALGYELGTEPGESTPPTARPEAPSGQMGGLVLVGPFPIFFGAWKNVSRRTRLLAAVAGGVLFLAVLVLFVLWVR